MNVSHLQVWLVQQTYKMCKFICMRCDVNIFLDHKLHWTIECTKILADKFMRRKFYSYLKLKFVKHDFLLAATLKFWNWQHHSFMFLCVSSIRAYSKSLCEFATPEICSSRISYAICDRKSFHFRNNHVCKHSSSVVSVVQYSVFIFAYRLDHFTVYKSEVFIPL